MTRLLLILALSPLAVMASTPSYWWSQMLVKPDARTSQEFFFVPGTNMVFTYATNHVILNAGGGGGGGTTNNYYYTNNNYYTNTTYITNNTVGLSITQNVVLWSSLTNWLAYTNVFSNGLLVASGEVAAIHCASLILPGGGYLTQPGGSTLCLP